MIDDDNLLTPRGIQANNQATARAIRLLQEDTLHKQNLFEDMNQCLDNILARASQHTTSQQENQLLEHFATLYAIYVSPHATEKTREEIDGHMVELCKKIETNKSKFSASLQNLFEVYSQLNGWFAKAQEILKKETDGISSEEAKQHRALFFNIKKSYDSGAVQHPAIQAQIDLCFSLANRLLKEDGFSNPAIEPGILLTRWQNTSNQLLIQAKQNAAKHRIHPLFFVAAAASAAVASAAAYVFAYSLARHHGLQSTTQHLLGAAGVGATLLIVAALFLLMKSCRKIEIAQKNSDQKSQVEIAANA